MHTTIKTILTLLVVILLTACKTPQNIAYFQDTRNNTVLTLPTEHVFHMQPEDKVNIIVSSKDQTTASIFSLTTTNQSQYVLGASVTPRTISGNRYSGYGMPVAYTVDKDGYIDFPILGKIKAQGLTRQELAKNIQQMLIDQKLLLDAVVTVEYVNLSVDVLGEVKNPGRLDLDKDHLTILDAISKAGDLNITGQRENVKVLRNENGKMVTYRLNLCAADSLVMSPAYYLHQNDIVYVSPNPMRMRQSTVNGNTVLTPSFWISVASLLTTITALIIR